MPNNQQGFNVQALKTDPKMWMRLAMPSKNGEHLENVFKEKENPFEKNYQAAVETLEKLAAEGKLYLRDFGRSRHFQKVEKVGEELKLGGQQEMKFSNRTADFGLSVLMRLSRAYFKWIGLERISNWFDGRLKRRAELNELNSRYKEEYKSLTKEEKKELKALRKHEKIIKKLEKIQKEAKLSEQTLNELRGQQAPTTTQQTAPTTTQQAPTTTQQTAPTTTQQAPTTTQQAPTTTQQAPTTTQQIPTPPQQQIPTPPQQQIPTPPQQQIPTPPQQQAPLTQPPVIQPNENTMQPTLTGDAPVQQIPPAPPLPNQFAVKQTTQQEIPDTKKEENEQGENARDDKIIINGVELTDETVNQFPPNVVEAFRVIQQMILEQEAAQKAYQQEQTLAKPEADREEQTLTDVEQSAELQNQEDLERNQEAPVINTNQVEEVVQQADPESRDDLEINQEEPVINTNQAEDVYLTVNTSNVEEREMTQEELEEMFNRIEEPEMTQEELERMFAGTDAPTMDGVLPTREIDAPLRDGADLEPEQVNIQQRHEDQAQKPLQERLAAEKEAMDSVVNWQKRLANTLFSHEEGSAVKDYYENIKDKPDGSYLLAGTVCGLLSAGVDPESKKQIMEGLLSGKPLGNEYDSRISESVTAYHHALEQMNRDNREPMTKLISDAALELGRQAGQEGGLSPRHVMIGRMISNAMKLADQHSLRLKFNDEQWATIRGAVQLSKLAQKHHDAKQFLGQEPMDLSSEDSKRSVSDLLMGNAVENLIQTGKYHGQQVTDVQILMGCGCLTVDNLTEMMKATRIRNKITEERVKGLMETPNGYDSARMAKRLGEELLNIAQEGYVIYQKDRQMDMQKHNQPENEQQLDPAQITQPL